jgi:pimeloyl-ACP methyl ester carboxylesterase
MMNSHALNKLSLRMLRSEWIARYQANTFKFPDPDMTEQYLAAVRAMTTENLDRPIAAFASTLFLPEGLGAVDCPVLVTAGSREARSMLGSADDIRSAIASARLEILAGADHTYPWSRFEDYNRLLEAWLR